MRIGKDSSPPPTSPAASFKLVCPLCRVEWGGRVRTPKVGVQEYVFVDHDFKGVSCNGSGAPYREVLASKIQ